MFTLTANQPNNHREIPVSERRTGERWSEYAGCRIALEGRLGTLVDIAEGGAKFECQFTPQAGETVRVDLPWGVPVRAVVLATESRTIRVKFDDLVEAPLR